MITKLLAIIKKANPEYEATFEEARMMNLRADGLNYTKGFAYIEEYRAGQYGLRGYVPAKTINVEIYFCKFGVMHANALDREQTRTTIENEIVRKFMDEYNASRDFEEVSTWNFYAPVPRFDSHEVSLKLQFPCRELNPCIPEPTPIPEPDPTPEPTEPIEEETP